MRNLFAIVVYFLALIGFLSLIFAIPSPAPRQVQAPDPAGTGKMEIIDSMPLVGGYMLTRVRVPGYPMPSVCTVLAAPRGAPHMHCDDDFDAGQAAALDMKD